MTDELNRESLQLEPKMSKKNATAMFNIYAQIEDIVIPKE